MGFDLKLVHYDNLEEPYNMINRRFSRFHQYVVPPSYFMKIIILSKSRTAHFNRRIVEEAQKTGLFASIISPSDCIISHNEIYDGANVEDDTIPAEIASSASGRSIEQICGIDLCFLRTPPYREDKDYFHLAARVLEGRGVPVINPPNAVEISGNKFRTEMLLEKAGIPVLPSILLRNSDLLDQAVERVGGYPVFLKTIWGTRGIGVVFCQARETLHSVAQTMWAYGANVMVERYARGSNGDTTRVLVFMDNVLGAIQCRGQRVENNAPDEMLIRSNLSRGGEGEAVSISEEAEAMAVSATKSTGLIMAGVDLIRDDGNWKVLEINSSPGIKGLEKATGKNIAGAVLNIIRPKIKQA